MSRLLCSKIVAVILFIYFIVVCVYLYMHMYNFLCSDSLLYIYFFLFLSTLHGVYTRDFSCTCVCHSYCTLSMGEGGAGFRLT